MNEATLDVGRALGIIAARWKTVALAMIVVTAVALTYTKVIAKPVYEAKAQVTYQEPARDRNPTGGFLPSTGITRENIATLVGNAGSNAVRQKAANEAGVTLDELERSITVQPNGDASMVNFMARSTSAEEAAELANTYARVFVQNRKAGAVASINRQIKAKTREVNALGKLKPDAPENAVKFELQRQLGELQTQRQLWSESIQLSNEAQVPDEPVWPRTMLTVFAAMFVGLGLGCGVALVTATVDRKVHSDALDGLPAPVLVKVPESQRAPKTMPLGPGLAEPLVADAFAALGARVMLDRSGEGAHVVLISSARSGEGKSSVASNLASALAQGGRRVVLVDADMRRPTQDQVFSALQGRSGLSQVLMGATDVEHALTLVAPNLAAIASGPPQANASVLLASVAFRSLVERLSNISEVIIIDAPPALAVTDALAMASAADQVLLCARVGTSNIHELHEAHAKFVSASSTPQAMVLVGTDRPTGYGYDSDMKRPISYPVDPQRASGPPEGGSAASVA